MKTIYTLIIVLGWMWLSYSSCRNTVGLDHIQDKTVRAVVDRAIKRAGGLGTYKGLDSITYTKRSVLYLADGSKESDQLQIHKYQLRPQLSGTITWMDSAGQHQIIYDGDHSSKVLNGSVIPNSQEVAKNSFLSNHYVLMMPFKLADPGVSLQYIGTIDTGDKVTDVIQANYSPDTEDNHSTDDTWWYYFDQKTGAYLYSMVYHAPTYAYIENTVRQQQGPLEQNLRRLSWRTDSLRNKKFLRAEFWYEDFRYPKR